MTTRLDLYNETLRHLSERKLGSLSENREPRRVLDGIWNSRFVRRVLEIGEFHFAARDMKLDYNPAIAPEFGYRYAFTKPDDWVKTYAVCPDEYMRTPLLQYKDAAGYWLADLTQIYVSFGSDDENFGGDLSKWPPSFEAYAACEMAMLACKRITGAEPSDEMRRKLKDAKVEAKSNAAMTGPTRFTPPGSWSNARSGRFTRWGSRHGC